MVNVQNNDILKPGTIPDDFICAGCGNEKDTCHQKPFGQYLVHQTISLYDEFAEGGKADEVDDNKFASV